MGLRLAADAVMLVHLLFVLFVVLGGLLALRWPRVAWVHVPCAAWGAAIATFGWICPLTPLENRLRRAAGGLGYEGGFVEHYIFPVLYPVGLTPRVQAALGVLVLVVNAAIYTFVVFRHRR